MFDMDFEEKERLARTRDSSIEAAAVRARAARIVSGTTQQGLGDKVGVKKAAISNTEKGRSFPSWALMTYFYREHRIDFNFMIHGDFSQLPQDVQDRLFAALTVASSEWDQRPSSD